MGTHPIFESDFDCLTDFRSDMRAELCHFSGLKIHPGHGMNHCKADGKVIRLLSSKSAALFHNKTNPRKLRWTILYRRKHKKGISQEASVKRRVRRNVKMTKAISGLSFDELLTKKNQSKEVRQKQRDNAIRAAKDKKKASEANKKANRAANKAANKAQAPKGGNKGRVPMKGGAKGGKR